ncbi:MAG TPA: type II toxin-antitoxin system VapC family toxin [Polyangia bacterium]
MKGFLLDTNVLSELRKGARADVNVRRWFERIDEDAIFLSVLVTGEIRRGIESIRKRDPRAATALERWLDNVMEAHSERVLPVNAATADEWGRLDARGSLPVVDGLLAATARVHDLTLVTRNVKDVIRTGVDTLDPFTPTAQ